MNRVVVPLSGAIKYPFSLQMMAIGVVIHIFCVGLPIALVVRRRSMQRNKSMRTALAKPVLPMLERKHDDRGSLLFEDRRCSLQRQGTLHLTKLPRSVVGEVAILQQLGLSLLTVSNAFVGVSFQARQLRGVYSLQGKGECTRTIAESGAVYSCNI